MNKQTLIEHSRTRQDSTVQVLQGTSEIIAGALCKYPQGGEWGWYSLVTNLKTFVYWNVDIEEWQPLKREYLNQADAPRIGSNGNWVINDIDTGMPARGKCSSLAI